MTAGMGAGVACAALGWILVITRSADPNYLSGVGSFLAMVGGGGAGCDRGRDAQGVPPLEGLRGRIARPGHQHEYS